MKSTVIRSSRMRTLAAAAFLCVAVTSLLGCTSRKQYAINESILIGERRQLEDEIYRVQFELRDALQENEQLRAKLEEREGTDGASAKRKPAQRRQNVAPVNARPATTTNEDFFPGGDALRTGANTTTSSRYPEYPVLDMEEISKLPDFAVVPDQRGTAPTAVSAPQKRVAQTGGVQTRGGRVAQIQAAPRTPARVSQVSYDEAQDDGYDAAEYAEEYDDAEADDDDNAAAAASLYDFEDEESAENAGASDWSPIAR